jgi:hypothetical protein
VTSTIGADESFTGMLNAGNHVPFSSATAKTPVPVETSPTASQFPQEVQATVVKNASLLLAGDACSVCTLQVPAFSINSAGAVSCEDVSSPTATQPTAVQLIPRILVPGVVETGDALDHVPPDSLATPATLIAPFPIGPATTHVVVAQLMYQRP